MEKSEEKPPNEEDEDSDDGDIEAQIQRELAGMQPVKDKTKKRPVEVTRLEMPCGAFFVSYDGATVQGLALDEKL